MCHNKEVSIELDNETTVRETQMCNLFDKMLSCWLKIKTDQKTLFGQPQKQSEVDGHEQWFQVKRHSAQCAEEIKQEFLEATLTTTTTLTTTRFH